MSARFFPLCWYDVRSPNDWEKIERIFKIKHFNSNSVIRFANLTYGLSVKNSGQAENWALNETHIGSDSSNTQFGKYELFQCIKSAEQLFTFVVSVFCHLRAVKWLSKPVAKDAEEGVWPKQEATRRQPAVRWPWGATEPQPVFPAAFTCHWLVRRSDEEQCYGGNREMGTQLQEKENSSTPVAL